MPRRYYSLYDWCINNGEKGQKVMDAFVGLEINDEDENVSDESWSEWADIGGTDTKKQIMKSLAFSSHQEVWWKCEDCNMLYKKIVSYEKLAYLYFSKNLINFFII